jgi:hypothetical protein
MGDTYAAVIFSDRDAHADSTKTQATAPAIFFFDMESPHGRFAARYEWNVANGKPEVELDFSSTRDFTQSARPEVGHCLSFVLFGSANLLFMERSA